MNLIVRRLGYCRTQHPHRRAMQEADIGKFTGPAVMIGQIIGLLMAPAAFVSVNDPRGEVVGICKPFTVDVGIQIGVGGLNLDW